MELKSGFLVAEGSRGSGCWGASGVVPATAGPVPGRCCVSSRVFSWEPYVPDAGTFLPETPQRRGPLQRPRCRHRRLQVAERERRPRSLQSQPSSSTPKLSWKENGVGFVFGCLAKPGHRWDNDFYKQRFDERRGEGVICNTHKGGINTRMPAAGTD